MAHDIVKAIRASGLSIYHSGTEHPDLLIGNETLQDILSEALLGLDLNFPLRTRSKVVKSKVCEALGYPIPTSFRKTKPRFPGQDFDTYVQKSNNLQIWNEEISPSRRYVVIRLSDENIVTAVKVVAGEAIAEYDTTGTLTQKYQAKSRLPVVKSQLVSEVDTEPVVNLVIKRRSRGFPAFLPIDQLFRKLRSLAGTTIPHLGADQERNRGGALHRAICTCIGTSCFDDSGQFPDIQDQLLEVKLQTASTIDLGLVSPDDTGRVSDLPEFRHCDVRYAVFYGTVCGSVIQLEHLVLTTGAEFFTFFQRFEGKIVNKKLQIRLPCDFFG
jgi:hypothetical protein